MSQGADNDEPDRPVKGGAGLDFTTPKKSREVLQATIDGHTVIIRQPKDAFTASVGRKAIAGTPEEQVTASDEWIDTVFDAASAKYVHDRLDDLDDDFDMNELAEINKRLLARWGGDRPTGSSSGSSKRSRATGRRSTARSR